MKKLIILLALLSLTPACAYYSGGPWRGRVLDMETREPIEGAAVVAVWSISRPNLVEFSTKYHDAQEVITDQNGLFEFGKYRELTFVFSVLNEPKFYLFKPGYGRYPATAWLENKGAKTERTEYETTYLLPKLTLEERKKNLLGINPLAHDIFQEKMPFYYRHVNEEKSLIKKGE